jgi:hypothetical protein
MSRWNWRIIKIKKPTTDNNHHSSINAYFYSILAYKHRYLDRDSINMLKISRVLSATVTLLSFRRAVSFVSPHSKLRHTPSLRLYDRSDRSTAAAVNDIDWQDLSERITAEVKEISECASLAVSPIFQPDSSIEANAIVHICDELDALSSMESSQDLWSNNKLHLRRRALEFKRYELFSKLMRKDYEAYVATASFLSPSRVPRRDLPNVQDIAYLKDALSEKSSLDDNGVPLVADCNLESVRYQDNLLDKTLLSIFRKLVTKNTCGVQSDKPGIEGLLDQGRTFMLQPGQTPEAQHKMVYDTLGGLMTPVLPPFYRIFMSGIVPKLGTGLDGKQIGPWFYAPWLTSFVTPPFFKFLVGPSYPNRRKDGQLGGLLVEKCRFLQESGCKGLCLHQCKLPAQQFFQDELGLALTVSPNFETQECQWSFGETPLTPSEDPSFPKGCLVGCESRKALAGTKADICN